jgi:hypothetical protein
MTGSKKPDKKEDYPWCECDCAICEIGAHERCASAKCHMPKWKDIKPKSPKRPN